MAERYTVGVWVVCDQHDIRCGEIKVATAVGASNNPYLPSFAEANANAKLIGAAPALLDALEKMVVWHGARGPGDVLLPADQQLPEVASAMRVIAAATGDNT